MVIITIEIPFGFYEKNITLYDHKIIQNFLV